MSILARGLRLRVRWNGWASIRLTLSKPITPRSGNCPGNLAVRKCAVADAVAIEPVSVLQFPANREKNREFFVFWAISRSRWLAIPMIAGLSTRIPYRWNREFLKREQGISAKGSGISAAPINEFREVRFAPEVDIPWSRLACPLSAATGRHHPATEQFSIALPAAGRRRTDRTST